MNAGTRNAPHSSLMSLVIFALTAACGAGLARGGDYAAQVASDAPIAWWRFDDAASSDGATAKDQLGKHAGTYQGGVAIEAAGPAGRSARFNGKAAYVNIPDDPAFAAKATSVEFWFRSSQRFDAKYWPGSATFITKGTEGAASSDWVIIGGTQPGGDDNAVIVGVGPRGDKSDTVLSAGGDLNDDAWHHVVWTRSADGQNVLYVDGAALATAKDGGGSIVNTRPIQLGGEALLKGGKFLDGSLAEVAIYARVLSAERVKSHFAAADLPAATSRPTSRPAPLPVLETMTIQNHAGLKWEFQRTAGGWALGGLSLHDKPVDAPLTAGLFLLRRGKEMVCLAGGEARKVDDRTAVFAGSQAVGEATVKFTMEVSLKDDCAAATLTPGWSVDKELAGWEICVPYHGVGGQWRCTMYPFAGNSDKLDRPKLTYVGVPGAILFRPDLSLVTLYGIDPASDYLNPTTWTGKTGFAFRSPDGPAAATGPAATRRASLKSAFAPQFRVGGPFSPETKYSLPLQIFLSDAGNSTQAITSLVRDWMRINQYDVQPLEVRTPAEALDIFIKGRRESKMWVPGKGYRIQDAWAVIYIPESPGNAYLDYLLYERTGDALWRTRAFETMDFVLKGQHADPNDRDFGAIESHYNLDGKRPDTPAPADAAPAITIPSRNFASTDRGRNVGLKPDMNAHAARYALMLYQRVKEKEGLDRKDWFEAAVRIADWVMKQQNADGGLPQIIYAKDGSKSMSVISGRALAAFPIIHRITGQQRYADFALQLERFLRTNVEDRFWYTGAHTDLPPQDYEADSVWHAVEYWLDKHDRTGDAEALSHARANALLAFLEWCPKQLSWVQNPTQTCHTEQQHFLQYSNYCYNNAKIVCLHRLAALTGQDVFEKLSRRVMQCGFWAQETGGPWAGSQFERMSDPWLGVSKDVNSKGTRYMSELATELNLQLLQLGKP